MITPQPPTTPAPAVPDALLTQWCENACRGVIGKLQFRFVAEHAIAWAWHQRDEEVRQAEQRGADAELEACCEWASQWRCMVGGSRPEEALRSARRLSPPTLREQALAELRLRRIATTGDGSVILSNDLLELTLAALQEDVK